MSLEYVLMLGLISIPIMVLIGRLTAMMMFMWSISNGVWMMPL